MSYQQTGQEKFLISGGSVSPTFFEQAIELSGTSKPTMLIDRGASTTEESFLFGRQIAARVHDELGIAVEQLQDHFGVEPTQTQLDDRIGGADVICVGGGSTKKLIAGWSRLGITGRLLARIGSGELVASGASAGALSWFRTGYSDSESYGVPADTPWEYINVMGAGALAGWATVHYSDIDMLGRRRAEMFQQHLLDTAGAWSIATGLDTYAGLQYANGHMTAIDLSANGKNRNAYFFSTGEPLRPITIEPGEPLPIPMAA